MKSAASAASPAKPPTSDRPNFALTGPSRAIDHDYNAARRDLADVRLAGLWFAPHYATPDSWLCSNSTMLRAAPRQDSDSLGELAAQERFALLEISGDWAWGFRERDNRVGYVEVHALGRAQPA